MSVQVIQDTNGETTGIFIPITEWEALKKQYKIPKTIETEHSDKNTLLSELKEAIKELKLIEEGQMRSRPARKLLDEL